MSKYKIIGNMTGNSMEARLFADMAYHKLTNQAWQIPEIIQAKKEIICGRIAKPNTQNNNFSDMVNLAAKGWQQEQSQTTEN